ncbi:MAG: fibronectin type III domain-containing protein, partial [Gammaproteobacteria bacterium]|nr:fibronectin type III domain-containing protein [Gammaproteobacteria bacterium]
MKPAKNPLLPPPPNNEKNGASRARRIRGLAAAAAAFVALLIGGPAWAQSCSGAPKFASLSFSVSGAPVPLSPAFSPDTCAYTLTVPEGVSSVTPTFTLGGGTVSLLFLNVLNVLSGFTPITVLSDATSIELNAVAGSSAAQIAAGRRYTFTFVRGSAMQTDYTPTSVSAQAKPQALLLSWSPPADSAASTVSYVARWATKAANRTYLNPGEADGAPVGAGSYTITGLTGGTTYEVQIAGVNPDEEKFWADVVEAAPLMLRGIQITAPDTDGTCPVSHNAATAAATLAEGGDAVNLCVSLGEQPDNDVTLACAVAGAAPVTAAPAQLQFTTSNWETAQALALSIADNNLAHGTRAATLTCTASTTSGDVYDGALIRVALTATDDDSLPASGTLRAGEVSEAGGEQSVAITAALGGSVAPGADCAVTVTVGSAAIAGTAGDALAQSPGDYSALGAAPAITIAAGQLSGSGNMRVTPAVDSDLQTESIPLSAAASCDGVSVDFGAAEILIRDTFNPNVDGADGADWKDGVLIARYLAGARGEELTAGLAAQGATLDAAGIAAKIRDGVQLGSLDLDGANGTTLADGIMLTRYLLGMRAGDGITTRMSGTAEATVISN